MFFARRKKIKSKLSILEQRIDNAYTRLFHVEQFAQRLNEDAHFIHYMKQRFDVLQAEIDLIKLWAYKFNNDEKNNI